MKLYLTDYLLESCRNIRHQIGISSNQPSGADYQVIEDGNQLSLSREQMEVKFEEDLGKAERLIDDTGYHRRDKLLAKLKNRGGLRH